MALATSQIGRLAFRVEGSMWNAYWAKPDTMQDAIWLGSIAMKGIEGKPKRKKVFMNMMQELATEVLEEITGAKVETWKVKAAPEGERTKE